MGTGTSESGADGERGRELEQVAVALAQPRRWPNRAQDLSPPELRDALAKLMGDPWHGVAPHGEGHLQQVIASVPDQSLDGGEPADDAGPGPDPPRGPAAHQRALRTRPGAPPLRSSVAVDACAPACRGGTRPPR